MNNGLSDIVAALMKSQIPKKIEVDEMKRAPNSAEDSLIQALGTNMDFGEVNPDEGWGSPKGNGSYRPPV